MDTDVDTEDDAQKIESLFHELHQLTSEEHAAGRLKDDWSNTNYSERLLTFLSENSLELGYNDAAIFLYEYHLKREGDRLVLRGGAKIELYSAHSYPGRYGRGR